MSTGNAKGSRGGVRAKCVCERARARERASERSSYLQLQIARYVVLPGEVGTSRNALNFQAAARQSIPSDACSPLQETPLAILDVVAFCN